MCSAWDALIVHDRFWEDRLALLRVKQPQLFLVDDRDEEVSRKRQYRTLRAGVMPWSAGQSIRKEPFETYIISSKRLSSPQSTTPCLGRSVWLHSEVVGDAQPPGGRLTPPPGVQVCSTPGGTTTMSPPCGVTHPPLMRLVPPSGGRSWDAVLSIQAPPPTHPKPPAAQAVAETVICNDASDDFQLQGITRVTAAGGAGGLATGATSSAVQRAGKVTQHFVRVLPLQAGRPVQGCTPLLLPTAARVLCVRLLVRTPPPCARGGGGMGSAQLQVGGSVDYDHLVHTAVGDVSGAMRYRPLKAKAHSARQTPPVAIGLAGCAGGLVLMLDCNTGSVLRYIAAPMSWVSTLAPAQVQPEQALQQCVLRWEMEHNSGPSRQVDVCSLGVDGGTPPAVEPEQPIPAAAAGGIPDESVPRGTRVPARQQHVIWYDARGVHGTGHAWTRALQETVDIWAAVVRAREPPAENAEGGAAAAEEGGGAALAALWADLHFDIPAGTVDCPPVLAAACDVSEGGLWREFVATSVRQPVRGGVEQPGGGAQDAPLHRCLGSTQVRILGEEPEGGVQGGGAPPLSGDCTPGLVLVSSREGGSDSGQGGVVPPLHEYIALPLQPVIRQAELLQALDSLRITVGYTNGYGQFWGGLGGGSLLAAPVRPPPSAAPGAAGGTDAWLAWAQTPVFAHGSSFAPAGGGAGSIEARRVGPADLGPLCAGMLPLLPSASVDFLLAPTERTGNTAAPRLPFPRPLWSKGQVCSGGGVCLRRGVAVTASLSGPVLLSSADGRSGHRLLALHRCVPPGDGPQQPPVRSASIVAIDVDWNSRVLACVHGPSLEVGGRVCLSLLRLPSVGTEGVVTALTPATLAHHLNRRPLLAWGDSGSEGGLVSASTPPQDNMDGGYSDADAPWWVLGRQSASCVTVREGRVVMGTLHGGGVLLSAGGGGGSTIPGGVEEGSGAAAAPGDSCILQ